MREYKQYKWYMFSIIFGIFLGTLVSNWIYFLLVGVIGLLFIIYCIYWENKFAVQKGDEQYG